MPDRDSLPGWPVTVDHIVGHSLHLELLLSPMSGPDGECCGGYLSAGSTRVWLDADHARNCAERARAAIDHALLGAFPHHHEIRRPS
jgi:hypothetical protein